MSKIEWTDETWNPVTGCTKISAGCKNCYAERMARRLAGRCGYPEAPHHFDVTLHPERLEQPLHWRKPRRVFVCSMSDFFHPLIPTRFQAAVLSVIKRCPQHTFIVLTKRPGQLVLFDHACGWEYDNVWLGVTAENQEMATERIDLLLGVAAPVRFVNVEPMLGPINMTEAMYSPHAAGMSSFGFTDGFGYEAALQWIICGAETGPGHRSMREDWVRDLRDQCVAADVPFFYKQKMVSSGNWWGADKKVSMPELDGRVWDQMPVD